ncbi:cytochrome P450, partial [Mycena latifolia]
VRSHLADSALTQKYLALALLVVVLLTPNRGTWQGELLLIVPLIVLGVLIAVPLYRLSPFHPLYGLPGPVLYKISGLPMFYHAFWGTQHLVVKGLHDTYGSVVQTAPNSVSFTSLAAIRKIYGSSGGLNKTTAYDMHGINLKGEGLFYIKDKTLHGHRRRIWNRSFTEEAIRDYHGPMVSQIENLIIWLMKRSQEDGRVDLVKLLFQYTYDSTNAVFFSGHAFYPSLLDSDDSRKIVSAAIHDLSAFEFLAHAEPLFYMVKFMPWILSLPGISRFHQFEAVASEAAHRRLREGSTFRDGISYWFDGEGGQPRLDERDLPTESELVLVGGSDAIGAISAFAMYFLFTNSEWFRRLRDELDATFIRDSLNHHLDALKNLVVLNAIIQESLRLGMQFPGLPRIIPPEGLSINGRHIPAGTSVSVPVWTHHVDPEYFPEPYAFNPSRWIKNGEFCPNEVPFLAFGAGPFRCVGSRLGYAQLRILLANLVLRVDIHPTADFDAGRFWRGVRNSRATTFLEPLWVGVVPRPVQWVAPLDLE